MSSFFSMSRVDGWFLLKKINKPTSLFYLILFLKVFEKTRKTSLAGLVCENCGITNHSLLKLKSNKDTLLEIWGRCCFQLKNKKDKKGSHHNIQENMCFKQSSLTYINRRVAKEGVRLKQVQFGLNRKHALFMLCLKVQAWRVLRFIIFM